MKTNSKPVPLVMVLIVGPAFVAGGLAVIIYEFQFFNLSNFYKPTQDWILIANGVFLFCMGACLLLVRFFKKLAIPFGIIAALSFVCVFNWIAFGPGERHFKSSSTFHKKSAISEIEGRIAFGIFAGAMDLIIIYSVVLGPMIKTWKK